LEEELEARGKWGGFTAGSKWLRIEKISSVENGLRKARRGICWPIAVSQLEPMVTGGNAGIAEK
jgi:hypothetical protein